jgi:uncharacterized membrane protein
MVERGGEGSGETRLETWISIVLMAGVAAALILEAWGIALLYRASHSLAISHDKAMFIHGRNFFILLGRRISGTDGSLGAVRVLALGIVVLILTPYTRTVMSVVYFASRKNLKYFFITLFVLAVLTISLMMH